MSDNSKLTIFLQHYGEQAFGGTLNFQELWLRPYGMPSSGLELGITNTLWSSIVERIKDTLNHKFLPFNRVVTDSYSTYNSAPAGKRCRIVFLDVGPNSGPNSLFYSKLRVKLGAAAIPNQINLPGIAFRNRATGFVFLENAEVNLFEGPITDMATTIAAHLIGINMTPIPSIGQTTTDTYASWSAVSRSRVSDDYSSKWEQWHTPQRPIERIGKIFGYIKDPTPAVLNNVNNSWQDDPVKLIKIRHVSKRNVRKENGKYLIHSYFTSKHDEDYFKILFKKGKYRIFQENYDGAPQQFNSMCKVDIELFNPFSEVPKKISGLDSPDIISECNKIKVQGQGDPDSVFYFNEDTHFGNLRWDNHYENAGIEEGYFLAKSSSVIEAPGVYFEVIRPTFVYLKVTPGKPVGAISNYSSLGMYFLNIKETSTDADESYPPFIEDSIKYPSCYAHLGGSSYGQALLPALGASSYYGPRSPLYNITILENGEPRKVAFYLQEEGDDNTGGSVIVKKLNTVVNGKLVELKYIVNNIRYAKIPEDEYEEGGQNRFFLATSDNAYAALGYNHVFTQFYAAGMEKLPNADGYRGFDHFAYDAQESPESR